MIFEGNIDPSRKRMEDTVFQLVYFSFSTIMSMPMKSIFRSLYYFVDISHLSVVSNLVRVDNSFVMLSIYCKTLPAILHILITYCKFRWGCAYEFMNLCTYEWTGGPVLACLCDFLGSALTTRGKCGPRCKCWWPSRTKDTNACRRHATLLGRPEDSWNAASEHDCEHRSMWSLLKIAYDLKLVMWKCDVYIRTGNSHQLCLCLQTDIVSSMSNSLTAAKQKWSPCSECAEFIILWSHAENLPFMCEY